MPIPKKLFAVLDLPVISALLQDADLTLVDIGGRGSAFYPFMTLAPFAHYVVSEPDAGEAARLRDQLPRAAPWRMVTVMTEAIASRRGIADLHVASEPGMSSLLEPDQKVTARFHLASKFKIESVVEVPTLPLDDAAAQYGFAGAACLKADTQGTELDILASGPRLVGESLLGVHVESCFHAFYTGQAVFADVDSHLRQRGFMLVSLNRTALRRSGYRTHLYSKRVIAWAHCLYLREPDTLLDAATDASRRRMSRLLALAVAFQHFDLAFEIAAIARRGQLLPESDSTRLVEELERCAALSTRYMQHKAQERVVADALMAPSLRDKSHLE